MSRCFTLLVALFLLSPTLQAQSAAATAAPSQVHRGFGANLPFAFESNKGQTDMQVRYLARGPGYSLYLTSRETVLVLQQPGEPANLAGSQRSAAPRQQVLRLQWQGANPEPAFMAESPLPGISNYFSGSNPVNWHTHIPNFGRVRLQKIYPGVDVVYYGNPGQLEYDFRIEAGADLNRIALRVSGAEKLFLDANGDLVLQAGGSEVRNLAPVIYQEQAGRRISRRGHYVIHADKTVGFAVENYDHSKALVIDPILRYSTYLGGSSGGTVDFPLNATGAGGIALDSFGFAYITGNTATVDFPTTSGAFQTACPSGAATNCTARLATFVTKLNRTGTQLVYSTYLTGSFGTTTLLQNAGTQIAVDQLGNAHVTGAAYDNFPTTITALQQSCAFEIDFTCAFYTKLNFDGSQLLYSTYYGTQDRLQAGANFTIGSGVALDPQGNAYLTGLTSAPDLITTAGAFHRTFGGGSGSFDAFVAKFNPRLSGDASLVYGTYLGRSGDNDGTSIAVDRSGNAYVVGTTNSNQFPHTRSFGAGTGGTFLVKLSPGGRSLLYSNLLHGAVGTGVVVDSSRNAYITGAAMAQGFPTTPGAAQRTFGGGSSDAFVAKINSSGSALVYSSFLGGNGADIGNSIALDAARHAFIIGTTTSTNLRVTPGALQSTRHGPMDAFVTELFVAGTGLVFSTYFGGSGSESGSGIAVDPLGSAYISGSTSSGDLKVTSSAFQKTIRGASLSGFVAKISPAADLALTMTTSVTHADFGQHFNYSLHVLNKGPESTLNVTLFDPLPEGVVFLSASAHGCDSLSTPAGGTRGDVTCKRGFLDRNSTIDVVITVKVQPPVGGEILNQAAVLGDAFDPNQGNNTASVTVGVP
jgi:uncharacterized repeat protein (TIGR01451 family)